MGLILFCVVIEKCFELIEEIVCVEIRRLSFGMVWRRKMWVGLVEYVVSSVCGILWYKVRGSGLGVGKWGFLCFLLVEILLFNFVFFLYCGLEI